MRRRLLIFEALICAAASLLAAYSVQPCPAQELSVPASITAGDETSITTTGSGTATFYLVGPGVSRKTEVPLGQSITLSANDLKNSGDYLAILCSGSCQKASFYVMPAEAASLAFLVHPSRVPTGQNDAVSGVAFPFDQFNNLVLTPETVNFQLTEDNASVLSRLAKTRDGVAWFRTASGKSAGVLQVVVSVDDLSAHRAVQQVASDPCNLRIEGQRNANGILVETAPVHDCAGNPVPDGTIVTFTAADAKGKNTVDAPIKKGVARAQMSASGTVVISAASGVVMGNELRIGANQ